MPAIGGVKILNLGHRGASGYAPENTLAAFRLAAKMGSDGVELDVRLSSDKVPVVFHDHSLNRIFGRKSLVSEKTVKALKMLSFGPSFGEQYDGERIPTLEETLKALKGMIVNVELKGNVWEDHRIADSTVEIVKGSGMSDKVVLSSFNPILLARVKKLTSTIKTAFLFEPNGPPGLRGPWAGYALHVDFLNPFKGMADAAHIMRWHRHGYGVMVWTVNDEEEMRSIIKAGTDAIITNFPDKLSRLLETAGRGPS